MWELGAHLLLVARSEKALSELKAALASEGRSGQVLEIFPADLADLNAPQAILSRAKRFWRKLDVLINNAAIQGPIGRLWENSWEEWQRTIETDLLAPVRLCQEAIPWMMEFKQGKIINLSGGGATGPRPNFSAYGTAKAALVRFSETLAHEAHSLGIEINCIAPGAMNTQMLEAVRQAGPEKAGETEYAQVLKSASDPVAQQQRAVDLCCFLASSASDGITGKLISALWDPWETLPEHRGDLSNTDIYTLRRIMPKDRGKDWG
jgi:NAD(P)-dependent dehydrogenase (short-subunit alcohol dehydrogenase family)